MGLSDTDGTIQMGHLMVLTTQEYLTVSKYMNLFLQCSAQGCFVSKRAETHFDAPVKEKKEGIEESEEVVWYVGLILTQQPTCPSCKQVLVGDRVNGWSVATKGL